MIAALGRFELSIPAGESLKDKRRVVSSIKARLHSRLRLSVAEVGHQDSHRRVAIGIAGVSSEKPVLEKLFRAAEGLVENSDGCTVERFEVSYIRPFEESER